MQGLLGVSWDHWAAWPFLPRRQDRNNHLTRIGIWIGWIRSIFNWKLIDPRQGSVCHFFRRWLGCKLTNDNDPGKKKTAPWKPSWMGAARISSAKGNGIRWKPAGSLQPLSSSFSSCEYVRKIELVILIEIFRPVVKGHRKRAMNFAGLMQARGQFYSSWSWTEEGR